ncbi:MAG: hypothetical protein KA163_12785 [Bacteroidia bacterium]|nr:hypothetical protein [Bacteroidia bacterium]
MKALLFLFLLPFSLLSQTKVNVQIMQKGTYCGGARPNPEILANHEAPKPFANKKFVLVSANGKTCTVTTNAKGYFKVKLKAGSYKGYEAWRYYKKTPDGTDAKNFDMECLKGSWEKVDMTIDAQKKTQSIKIDIDDAYCNHTIPCLLNPQYPQ